MPVPKKRHSNARQGSRRAKNYQLSAKGLGKCPQCGASTLPHQACPACGTYRGRQVIKIKTKKGKKEKGKK
ncbi:MAG: 50S ribosomal protein L32 [Candidatus Margulisbacteria bacterium]|nr:50S ribosomal protein L32 [Candidatus Margulisiibacteriota bacterium]